MKNTTEIKIQVDPQVYRLIEKVMENIQQIETLLKENKELLAEAIPHSLRAVKVPQQLVD